MAGKNIPKGAVYILIFAVAAAGVYYWQNRSTSKPDGSAVPVIPQSTALQNKDAQDILDAINMVNDLGTIDTKFFEDPRFTSLKNTSVSIPEARPTERIFKLYSE